MSQTNLHEVAIGYLLAHQGEHLSSDRAQLIARCTEHLQQQGTTADSANVIALKAIGEIEARGNSVHVDLSQTTSYTVFVIDPATRQRFAFTAAELLRIARQRFRGDAAAVH